MSAAAGGRRGLGLRVEFEGLVESHKRPRARRSGAKDAQEQMYGEPSLVVDACMGV